MIKIKMLLVPKTPAVKGVVEVPWYGILRGTSTDTYFKVEEETFTKFTTRVIGEDSEVGLFLRIGEHKNIEDEISYGDNVFSKALVITAKKWEDALEVFKNLAGL